MPTFNQLMYTPVDALELLMRTNNCLLRADISTIGQMLTMGYRQLRSVRNLSEKSLDEVITTVCKYCLRQGYDVRAMFEWSRDDDETPKRDDDDTRRYF